MSWTAETDGRCAGCGGAINVGEEVRWADPERPGGTVEHVTCPPSEFEGAGQ